MGLLDMESVEDIPRSFPVAEGEEMQWLTNLATQVVDFCWKEHVREDLRATTLAFQSGATRPNRNGDVYYYCDCGEGE